MMQGRFFNIVIIMLVVLLTMPELYGQIDTIKVDYTEEKSEQSDFKLKEKYKYLHRNMIEETSLFKISLLGFTVGVNDQLQFLKLNSRGNILAYERKLCPSFSVLYQNLNYFTLNPTLFAGTPKAHILNSSSLGVRYYYDQKRMIAKGRSANNFSADYITVQGDNLLLIRINYGPAEKYISKPSVGLLYGIQRRLGKFGYFDVNAGARYNTINYSSVPGEKRSLPWEFISNFSIGLGF